MERLPYRGKGKATEAEALAEEEVQEGEKEKEKKNLKNEEKTRKGKEREMSKSLIELQLPNLPNSGASRLWATRIAHPATTILQANSKKAQIAIIDILLSADSSSRETALLGSTAASCMPRTRQHQPLLPRQRQRRRRKLSRRPSPRPKARYVITRVLGMFHLFLYTIVLKLCLILPSKFALANMPKGSQ